MSRQLLQGEENKRLSRQLPTVEKEVEHSRHPTQILSFSCSCYVFFLDNAGLLERTADGEWEAIGEVMLGNSAMGRDVCI